MSDRVKWEPLIPTVCGMSAAGLSRKEIAYRLGVTLNALKVAFNRRRIPLRPPVQPSTMSAADVDRAIAMRADGLQLKTIALELGVHHVTLGKRIQARRKELGMPDPPRSISIQWEPLIRTVCEWSDAGFSRKEIACRIGVTVNALNYATLSRGIYLRSSQKVPAMRNALLAAVAALTIGAAHAAPPAVGSEDYEIMHPFAEWVMHQNAPTGQWCCDISDGRPVEARTVGEHWQVYVTAEKFPGSTPGWHDVPDVAVLHNPNPTGVPIAWVIHDHLYCFAPAGGV
jgi:hypothetical protein